MLKDVKIMSRIKRFFGIILSWIVVMSVYFIPACAAEAENGEVRVFDFAGLFSQEEKEELEEEALRLREELKAEFIVLTVDETRGIRRRKWRTNTIFPTDTKKALMKTVLLF